MCLTHAVSCTVETSSDLALGFDLSPFTATHRKRACRASASTLHPASNKEPNTTNHGSKSDMRQASQDGPPCHGMSLRSFRTIQSDPEHLLRPSCTLSITLPELYAQSYFAPPASHTIIHPNGAYQDARAVKQTLFSNEPNLRGNALIHTKIAVCNRIQLRTLNLHNPHSLVTRRALTITNGPILGRLQGKENRENCFSCIFVHLLQSKSINLADRTAIYPDSDLDVEGVPTPPNSPLYFSFFLFALSCACEKIILLAGHE